MVDRQNVEHEYRGPLQRTWVRKFADSFRGLSFGVRGQSSFVIHLLVTGAVIVAAIVLQVALWEWCGLILCIALVLTAELFNSSLERLAKEIDRSHNPRIGEALDIASAAVLIAAIGAAIVGAVIFLHHIVTLF